MGVKPGEALIYQYIQESEIASDFARFYQLYEKYGQDYQVDHILQGTMDPGEYEDRIRLAQSAGMDERLTLEGMILAGWSHLFTLYIEKTEYVRQLHECLVQAKKELEQGNTLQDNIDHRKHALQIKAENGLLHIEEELMEQKLLRCLEECKLEAAKIRVTEPEEVMDVLRAFLQKSLDERKRLIEEIQKSLDRGISFVETAFGEGPEMTFLMSDLSQNQNAMEFIRTFGNEAFFLHSDHLKVSKKRQELMEKIERVMHE